MVQLLAGFQVAQALYVAAKLDVATVLLDGPASVEDLAVRTGANLTWMETQVQRFTGAMADLTHGIKAHALAGYALPAGEIVADIGGADGTVLGTLLAADGDATRRGIVFDLPHVVSAAPARPGARLVAIEFVVPPDDEMHMSKMIDLTMAGMLTGRERTLQEFDALLGAAGFRLERVVDNPTPLSILEAALSDGR